MSGPYRDAPPRGVELRRDRVFDLGGIVRAHHLANGHLVIERCAVRRVLGTRIGVLALAGSIVGSIALVTALGSPGAFLAVLGGVAALGIEKKWLDVVESLELGPQGISWTARASRVGGELPLDQLHNFVAHDDAGKRTLRIEWFVPETAQRAEDAQAARPVRSGSFDLFGPLEADDDVLTSVEAEWIAQLLRQRLGELRATAST